MFTLYRYRSIIVFALLLLNSCGKSSGPHKPISKSSVPTNTTSEKTSDLSYNDIQPILQKRCSACHDFASSSKKFYKLAQGGENSKVYQYIINKSPIEMPPPSSPQSQSITQEEREEIGEWVINLAHTNSSPEATDVSDQNAPTSADEESTREDYDSIMKEGFDLIRSQNCFSCHNSTTGIQAPRILGQSDLYIEAQLMAYKKGQRKSPFMMEPIARSLSDKEIHEISFWLANYDK